MQREFEKIFEIKQVGDKLSSEEFKSFVKDSIEESNITLFSEDSFNYNRTYIGMVTEVTFMDSGKAVISGYIFSQYKKRLLLSEKICLDIRKNSYGETSIDSAYLTQYEG